MQPSVQTSGRLWKHHMMISGNDTNRYYERIYVYAAGCIDNAEARLRKNISDTSSVRGWEGGGRAPVYAAMKAAVNGFTKTFAKMVAPRFK